MPQLSLYIDAKTLKELETAAKIENLSLSKYAVRKLSESMRGKWPDHYEDLFGAIDDESFDVQRELAFKDDSRREAL